MRFLDRMLISYLVGKKSESIFDWVKKVFDTNMTVDIGQSVSRGLFLGQF